MWARCGGVSLHTVCCVRFRTKELNEGENCFPIQFQTLSLNWKGKKGINIFALICLLVKLYRDRRVFEFALYSERVLLQIIWDGNVVFGILYRASERHNDTKAHDKEECVNLITACFEG